MQTRYKGTSKARTSRPSLKEWMVSVRRSTQFRSLFLISLLSLAILHFYAPGASSTKKDDQPTTTKVQSPTTSTNGDLKKGTPKYETVLPSGASVEKYGGWTRVSPPSASAVYAYADKIGKVPIIVSQQPIPKEYKADVEGGITELARSYDANDKIVAASTTVYIGTSAKGPQSVIFTKGDLLILIKAAAVVSDDDWISYVESLR